jgi:hypothetical protein
MIQETGFVGFQYLMEAHALRLNGNLTAPITPSERTAVISALGLPSADLPVTIFATGWPPMPGVEGSGRTLSERLEVTPLQGGGVRLTYQLAEPGPVRLAIYDLAGRPVRSWGEIQQSAGVHSVEWNGLGDSGRSLPAGSYFCRLAVGGAEPTEFTARVTLAW